MNICKTRRRRALAALLLFLPLAVGARADKTLDAAHARYAPLPRQWERFPVRTVAMLSPLPAEPALDPYGGRMDKSGVKTGFFHTQKIGARWWLVDPDGHLFLHVGVDTVSPGPTSAPVAWASSATHLLHDNGFNGAGAWSATPALRAVPAPLVYTVIGQPGTTRSGGFLATFGKQHGLTRQVAGHVAYPHGCIPVFDPDFPAFCDAFAKPLAALKDDPYLLGYFSDNEMPLPVLDNYLALRPDDRKMGANYRAAKAWLAARKGWNATVDDITEEDRDDWTEYVLDRYFALTTAAIRRYDPHHLCLGSRFVGYSAWSPAAFRAAGRYLDVIAINDYGVWQPDPVSVAEWTEWSGKPVLISEFYAKGMDSGMPNTTGAGWTVATQGDRGLFYQTFTLGLLESKNVVGWHWFKYRDNDPADKTADPSNRDSNKGVVSLHDVPYTPLLDQMRALNDSVYAVADKFDAAP